ncbi:hypothetical protein SAV14893_097630 [Streptomyces avermitilis]|uniref:Uncharacterized protein n=3 Tax=Streptomyces avermitilis TaxID=33903 RepID=A0A4D4MEH8_STRAX|nr:hypothetical protein SAV14893_097630 [Streptomyces avermitilis]
MLHRTLAHPQVFGDVRSPVTSCEPHPGLQPDPFTRSPPLSGQAPTIRVPHSTGIPQGSPNVTTRRQPEKVSSDLDGFTEHRLQPDGRLLTTYRQSDYFVSRTLIFQGSNALKTARHRAKQYLAGMAGHQ